MRELLIGTYLITFKCFYQIFCLLPVQNKTLFWVTYGDNAKPINDRLQVQHAMEKRVLIYDMRYVDDVESWNVASALPNKKRYALRIAYSLATSKMVFIDNYEPEFSAADVRKGARRAQVWHAAGTLKEFALTAVKSRKLPIYIQDRFRKTYRNYGDFIVPGNGCAELFARAMDLEENRFLHFGMPRTDYWFAKPDHTRQQLIEELDIKNDKVLLYAPTYREYQWDIDETLEALQQLTHMGWTVLIKLHPTSTISNIQCYSEKLIFVDKRHSINDYLLVTDVLVTDYSSIPFEACLLDIPTFLYTPDYDKYDKEQGTLEMYPNPLPVPATDQIEVLISWLTSDQTLEENREVLQTFKRIWYEESEGHATERIIGHYYK